MTKLYALYFVMAGAISAIPVQAGETSMVEARCVTEKTGETEYQLAIEIHQSLIADAPLQAVILQESLTGDFAPITKEVTRYEEGRNRIYFTHGLKLVIEAPGSAGSSSLLLLDEKSGKLMKYTFASCSMI